MVKKIDLAVVLGTRFDDKWRLRDDVLKRLDKTVELYEQGEIKKIIVCGKWTIWYDWLNITPPTTEAQLMKDYLVIHGVSARDIVKEERSKDTIGNLYYLNLYMAKKPTYKMLLIVCANQRVGRIKFLASKILNSRYQITYCLVDAPNDEQSSLGSEIDIHEEQKLLLQDVISGNDQALRHKLYKSRYYTDQARDVRLGKRKNELV